jgi:hypothetical protein
MNARFHDVALTLHGTQCRPESDCESAKSPCRVAPVARKAREIAGRRTPGGHAAHIRHAGSAAAAKAASARGTAAISGRARARRRRAEGA